MRNKIDSRIINEILKRSRDPIRVWKSTLAVFKNLSFIDIDFEKIGSISKSVREKIDKKQILTADQFGALDPTPQLIFILDSINFCFWAKKAEEKWTVEYPKSNFISNGWYALVAAIERARNEGIPILDAKYLSKLNLSDAKYIFRSSNGTPIPLLLERYKILNQIGKTLLKKYNGDIYNFLVKTGLDAANILTQLIKDFPSFEDFSLFNNKRINFYKRAQIFVYDVSFLKPLKIKNLKVLTAFADYKIPQILRAFEITKYKPELAKKIDSYTILKSGSREEIEIRVSTIWICELIAYYAGIKSVLVDNVLWKLSQSLKDVKPYHRVLTTAY